MFGAALASPNSAVIQQINRLKDALKKDGNEKEAKSIESLLASSKKSIEMTPSRIKQSFAMNKGEVITSKTSIPVDKETSIPIAEVFFNEICQMKFLFLRTILKMLFFL